MCTLMSRLPSSSELIRAASGHALVLFTSYAAMSAVKERLRERESLPFPLLTLGRNAPAHH